MSSEPHLLNSREKRLKAVEPIPVKFFVDFRDYFGRFSIQIAGVISTFRILPPRFESKIGSKEPKNRLKLFTEVGS